jgi:parallel beta-helix repeat protein
LLLLLSSSAGVLGAFSNQAKTNPEDLAEHTPCIQYEEAQKLIKVRCGSTHLTDIYKQINNPSILGIENTSNGMISSLNHGKVWILDAGIVVEKEGGLIIDSSDTSWLKITSTPTLQLKTASDKDTNKGNSSYVHNNDTVISGDSHNIKGKPIIVVRKHNGDNPNGIHVHGSLKIDSVKITSWDPEKNDVIKLALGKRPGEEHTKSDYDTAEPRAFIRVSKLSTGTTNITNSEIAYLGYSCSRCSGLSYYGGEGSVINGNNIHHLLKGFYSKNTGFIQIDGNKFHDNYLYGIDPHTGSHDMSITNNIVYNNNASGIICSKHCYNLLIEGNEVYNNSGAARGIAFSINTTHSVAKNNYVHDQPRCISFNRASNHNAVYNNTILNCKIGVFLSNTGNNSIYDNTINGTQNGIMMQIDSNKIYNNKIFESKNGIVFQTVVYPNKTNAATDVSTVSSSKDNHHHDYLVDVVANNHIFNTENPSVLKKQILNNTEINDNNDTNFTN